MTVVLATLTLLAACLGFTYWRGQTGWKGRETVDGVEFTAHMAKSDLRGVMVGARTRAAVEFEIKPEGMLDRWAKRIGLSVEGQVGNHRFDERLYLICDDPHLLTGLRFDPALPEALLGLFATRSGNVDGVSFLLCRGGTVRLLLQTQGVRDDARRVASDVAPALRAVAARLDASAGAHRPDPFWIRCAALLGVASGLAVNGVVQVFRVGWNALPNTLDDGALAWLGALAGAIVLAALVAATLALLRGTSRAHLVLFQVLLLGTPGAFATAFTQVRDLNMDADRSAARSYQTHVVNTRITESRKGGTHYYVRLGDWPDSGGEHEFEVDHGHFPSIGTPITVHVRDGFLGLRWVESFERRE
jgi:hypothetical protein